MPTTTEPAAAPTPVIIDLGKKSRKKVKKLRKGQGRLIDEVQAAVKELSAQGVIKGSAQPVIVVVREKPDSPWGSLY